MAGKYKTYIYEQGNPGGFYDIKYGTVVIEAITHVEANEIAQDTFGIYFNGVDNGDDCPCCNDRWYEACPESHEEFVDIEQLIETEYDTRKWQEVDHTEKWIRDNLFDEELICAWYKEDGTIVEFDGYGQLYV